MPDPTPTPAPSPKRTRSTINRGHLDELANARKIAATAIDPAYVAALAAVDLDVTLAPQIVALALVGQPNLQFGAGHAGRDLR